MTHNNNRRTLLQRFSAHTAGWPLNPLNCGRKQRSPLYSQHIHNTTANGSFSTCLGGHCYVPARSTRRTDNTPDKGSLCYCYFINTTGMQRTRLMKKECYVGLLMVARW